MTKKNFCAFCKKDLSLGNAAGPDWHYHFSQVAWKVLGAR